jgi:hypothetical protein
MLIAVLATSLVDPEITTRTPPHPVEVAFPNKGGHVKEPVFDGIVMVTMAVASSVADMDIGIETNAMSSVVVMGFGIDMVGV